jgi:ribosome maturation factor RimP
VNKANLAERIRPIAEKAVEKQALELVHIEVVGAGKGRTVRIYIDKEAGVTHEDCARVSQAVEQTLDEQDPIPGSYTLEVSSPGIERGLYSLADFERFKGSAAKVSTHTPLNGQRNFSGKIVEVRDETIVFEDRTNGSVEIPYDFVKKANLEFDIEEELRQAKKRK